MLRLSGNLKMKICVSRDHGIQFVFCDVKRCILNWAMWGCKNRKIAHRGLKWIPCDTDDMVCANKSPLPPPWFVNVLPKTVKFATRGSCWYIFKTQSKKHPCYSMCLKMLWTHIIIIIIIVIIIIIIMT